MARNALASTVLAFALSVTMAGSASASLTVGVPGGAPVTVPFFANTGTTSTPSFEFEQIYSSSAFSGPLTINSLTFFAPPGGDPTLAGDYDFVLGTTTSPLFSTYPLALSNTQTFRNGAIGAHSGDLMLSGAPYAYNPADGNLVVEIIVTNQANIAVTNGGGFYSDKDGLMSRTWLFPGQAAVVSARGLVTEFNGPGLVPEPATWTLMLAGFAGLGVLLRARRKDAMIVA